MVVEPPSSPPALRRESGADGIDRPLSSWQQSLLRKALFATAIGCIAAPILAVAASGYAAVHYIVAEACGLWAIAALVMRRGTRRSVAVTYLVLISVLVAVTGYHSAWNPAVVVSLCYLVVAAGLLVGHRAVYLIVGCTFVALQLGAICVHLGFHRVPLSEAYHPRYAGNWIRISTVWLLIVCLAAWVLRFAMRAAERAASAAEQALEGAREQRAATERLRPERQECERRIRDSQKLQMVAQLGDGFAHVINNLLTVVHCACEDLKKASSQSAVRLGAASIRSATSECATRTRELLALSRPHAADSACVKLSDYIASLKPVLRARLRSNVAVEFDIGPTCVVQMPPSWAEQILTNLLLNAEQAMPNGGCVRVETRTLVIDDGLLFAYDNISAGEHAVVVVSDDGIGVTGETAARACEPFFTTKTRAKHAGLGLTLVHNMVRQLCGTIELRPLPQGTQVTILLPSADVSQRSARSTFADWPHPGTDTGPADACRASEHGSACACVNRGDAPLAPRATNGLFVARKQATRAPSVQQPLPKTPVLAHLAGAGRAETGVFGVTQTDQCSRLGDSGPNGAERKPRLACEASTEIDTAGSREPTLGTPLGDWRARALDELMTVEIVGMGFVTAVMALGLRGAFPVAVGCGVVTLLLGARLIKGSTYNIRLAATLVVTLGSATLAVVRGSYLGPTATGGLVLAIFIASVFGTSLVTIVSCVAAAFGLGLGGWLWGTGRVATPLEEYAGDLAANWVRIGFVLPTIASVIGIAVLRVFALVESHVVALRAARHELERSRELLQAEMDAVFRLEEARSRSARVEAGGRLTGMMAHDINNSLACIMAWAEYLDVAGQPDQLGEALKAIVESADYAEALVQQLQSPSDSDHRGPSIDVGRELARIQPMLDAAAQRRRKSAIALMLSSDEGCFVEIREHSLRRLLLNLISNARDACGSTGGTCKVVFDRHDNWVTLRVVDDGCGMEPDTLARLFDPFFTTKGESGTGLGLNSVAEIVRGTGGAIDVCSEPGAGTCVTIRWPLAAPSIPALEAPAPVSNVEGAARILLAEDNQSVRRVLAQGLTLAGYTVIEASDGDEAISLLEEQPSIDALCTDAVMPGAPIIELIRRFSERYPGRPRLVISGYLPEDLSAQISAFPDTVVLAKPFTHAQLVTQLNARLAPQRRGGSRGAVSRPQSDDAFFCAKGATSCVTKA